MRMGSRESVAADGTLAPAVTTFLLPAGHLHQPVQPSQYRGGTCTSLRRTVIARVKPEAIQYRGVFWIASQARNDVKKEGNPPPSAPHGAASASPYASAAQLTANPSLSGH